MFLQVLCILFVRGLYGLYVVGSLQVMCILLEGSMVWVYGGFFMYSLLLEVFVSKGFFRSFFFCLFLVFYSLCQRVSSGSLCLSEYWVSEGCFRSIVLECQRLNFKV